MCNTHRTAGLTYRAEGGMLQARVTKHSPRTDIHPDSLPNLTRRHIIIPRTSDPECPIAFSQFVTLFLHIFGAQPYGERRLRQLRKQD